jgi:hypothetical protein
MMESMRKCPKCGRYLPKSEFQKTSAYCKTCSRDYAWQYKYGISPDQYYEMYKAQEGKCKICGKELPEGQYLCVDHNAENGEIRGLLCNQCNKGLGFFHDDTEVMEKAIKYLKENE